MKPLLKVGVGDMAPDFTLAASDGSQVTLSQLRGKRVVLYFYPKDDTPGCTKEACGFRDTHGALVAKGALVFGISPDGLKAHQKFVGKYGLPFLLLVDADHRIAEAYGVWGEKKFMGRTYQGVHRVTFLVGIDGRVEKVWDQVKPEVHAAEVEAALSAD